MPRQQQLFHIDVVSGARAGSQIRSRRRWRRKIMKHRGIQPPIERLYCGLFCLILESRRERYQSTQHSAGAKQVADVLIWKGRPAEEGRSPIVHVRRNISGDMVAGSMTSQQLYEWLKRNWRQDCRHLKYLNSYSIAGGRIVWPNTRTDDTNSVYSAEDGLSHVRKIGTTEASMESKGSFDQLSGGSLAGDSRRRVSSRM